MPNIGPLEIGIVLVIALIVFGPKKLPDLGHSLGKSIREFKGSISGEDREDEKPAPATISSAATPAPTTPATPAATPVAREHTSA